MFRVNYRFSVKKKCLYRKHKAQGIMNMIKSRHITQKKEEAIAFCRWSQLVVLQFSPVENNSMIACEKASWWESSFNLLHLFILYPTCVGIEWLVGVGSLSMCGHPGSISGYWSNGHLLENLFSETADDSGDNNNTSCENPSPEFAFLTS